MSLAVLQGRPYHNFINSLKRNETKKEYRSALLRYLKYCKTTLEDSLLLPVVDIENMIIDYIMELKRQDLSHSSLNMNFCAIKHFYFMNDVRISKVKIGKFLGEPKRKNTDRGYLTPEIRTILDNCDLRQKVIVLTLATTSMRIGAISIMNKNQLPG
jgi:site-specific recombinase XerD